MILKSKIIGLTILVATTLSMAGCTVPTTEAGNTQTYYEGKITGITDIDEIDKFIENAALKNGK